MTTPDQTPGGPALSEPRSGESKGPDRTRIRLGLAMMLIGLAFMAYRLDLWELDLSRHHWPFILLVLGALKMLFPGREHGRRRSRRGGVWLISIGLWGVVSEFELFGLDYGTSWPLLIIAAGLNMVWRSLESPPPRKTQEN